MIAFKYEIGQEVSVIVGFNLPGFREVFEPGKFYKIVKRDDNFFGSLFYQIEDEKHNFCWIPEEELISKLEIIKEML